MNQQVKNYEKIKGMMRLVGVSPAKDSEFIQAKHHDQIHCGVEHHVFQTANRLSFPLSFLTLFFPDVLPSPGWVRHIQRRRILLLALEPKRWREQQDKLPRLGIPCENHACRV